MPSQISNKIVRRRNAVATDNKGSEIRQDDTVREIGGEQKQGVILHIHRSYLFLHNREQTENSGIFVARATNVATVAAKGGRVTQAASRGLDLSRMNPALQRNVGASGNGVMPPPKSYGRDKAIGQTVTISRGGFKGYLGIVKDTTDTTARVELHTKSQTITVRKDMLKFKDAITGRSIDYQNFAGRNQAPLSYASVPAASSSTGTQAWTGSRTPAGVSLEGGRTPAWAQGPPARTPAWAVGSRTPGGQPDPYGGRTPAWSTEGRQTVNPYAEGNRTSYGGLGGVSFSALR